MKDFDFQIKKNHEDITGVKDKLDGLSKDLDDLVSLYEIVSEQMNPFVGLSKVTKKRLDALENFTKEVDELKNRMGEIESIIEQNKGTLGDIERQIDHQEKIVTPLANLGELSDNSEKPQTPVDAIRQQVPSDKTQPQTPTDTIQQPVPPDKTQPNVLTETVQPQVPEVNVQSPVPTTVGQQTPATVPSVIEQKAAPQVVSSTTTPFMYTQNYSGGEAPPDYMDQVLAASLESFLFDIRLENMLDEFISGLKT